MSAGPAAVSRRPHCVAGAGKPPPRHPLTLSFVSIQLRPADLLHFGNIHAGFPELQFRHSPAARFHAMIPVAENIAVIAFAQSFVAAQSKTRIRSRIIAYLRINASAIAAMMVMV